MQLNRGLNKLESGLNFRAHRGKMRTFLLFYLYVVPILMVSCPDDIFTNMRCRVFTIIYLVFKVFFLFFMINLIVVQMQKTQSKMIVGGDSVVVMEA